MKIVTVIALFCAAAAVPSFAQASLYDPSIKHKPKDGVVKLYGAGGPHTAFKKVAEVWEKRSGTKVEIIAGPESRWSADAQADADILWGTSEQSMTAFLLTYKAFDPSKVKPIYIRPTVIAVKAGNPKNIQGFDSLLVEGMKIVVTEGKGIYKHNRDWVEVEAGDFMWLRAFCPQACYAGGPGNFRYLLYKDVNRHMALRPASATGAAPSADFRNAAE